MHSSLPRKKKPEDIVPADLTEPRLTEKQATLFQQGVQLFNERRFWEAHEVWEGIWKERSEESRIFFQGIIQAAAGYHLLVERPRVSGAIKNLTKALKKLDLFPVSFLGLDVEGLRNAIRDALRVLAQAGGASGKFPDERIARLGRSQDGQ